MAVVEVPKVKVEKLGLKPFHEFDEANDTWPRGACAGSGPSTSRRRAIR